MVSIYSAGLEFGPEGASGVSLCTCLATVEKFLVGLS